MPDTGATSELPAAMRRVPVTMTLKPVLVRQIKAEAHDQNRTVSNLVETLIDDYLKARQNPIQ
jgi:hypothetical protein